MRQWTDGTGRQMLASVEKIEDGKVHFQMKSGKVVSYQINKLSEEDQKIIKKSEISSN
jgi:coenzyme F420-reducing hydrogenase beta subunit